MVNDFFCPLCDVESSSWRSWIPSSLISCFYCSYILIKHYLFLHHSLQAFCNCNKTFPCLQFFLFYFWMNDSSLTNFLYAIKTHTFSFVFLHSIDGKLEILNILLYVYPSSRIQRYLSCKNSRYYHDSKALATSLKLQIVFSFVYLSSTSKVLCR